MALELAFETKALRDICESEKKAKHELGAAVAAQLKRRLADLQAVESIDELPVAKPTKNSNNCVIDLSAGHRLIATVGHADIPTLSSGKVDWSNVRRLKLLKIETNK
jgi:3-oxoacyl-ACP reductase-like protein